ncbi:MAG: hypothetical protein KBC62_00920 [Candidatus Pacebacteria bacterium]|nr:hypothetical protein [Candidatus Paceibacterota bacterium]MBP9842544.1 hypothetical protein [Candidatus Paceibacterota bacterium]
MKTQLTTGIFTQAVAQAGVAATLIVSLLTIGFFAIEPQIGHSAESVDFRVRQTITDETSFSVNPSNVTMNGGIAGLTGGTATGTTGFVVRSTNASGYSVTIDFYDNAGLYAMLGDEDGGEEIRDYALGAGTPTFNMTASTAAQFAYSVHSSSTADSADVFWTNGTTCNSGAGSSYGKCWKSPSTSAIEVVNRNTSATAGATSTLVFKVHVPSGATPTPTAQTYTATATLSVVAQ